MYIYTVFHKTMGSKDKGVVAILELSRGRQSLGIQKKGRQLVPWWMRKSKYGKQILSGQQERMEHRGKLTNRIC